MCVYTRLDLSRKRLDWHACAGDGTLGGAGAVPPDADGLAQLVHRLGDTGVLAVVEVMNGARFVHDQLELAGWGARAFPVAVVARHAISATRSARSGFVTGNRRTAGTVNLTRYTPPATGSDLKPWHRRRASLADGGEGRVRPP